MIILDGNEFITKDSAFAYLDKKLCTDFKLTNLDGLFDKLSEIDSSIEIRNYRHILKNLDSYGESLIKVFIKAAFIYKLRIDFLY